MKIQLKVCGMRDKENILQVAALRPDLMGFIFYPSSPRYVGKDFEIPEGFPEGIIKVGVFVNETVTGILAIADRLKLDFIQLHGHESVEMCNELGNRGMKIIKVFSVDESFDFSVTNPYKDVADYFLFDTKGKYYGGNAKTFDWSILNKFDQSVPFFLSGGLDPANIGEIKALYGMNMYAADVNSGVEKAPGVKDAFKIEVLQRQLRNLQIH